MKSRALLASLLTSLCLLACAHPDAAVVGDQGAAITGGEAACEPTSPRMSPLELYVQPDVGTTPFSDAIGRATRSVDVMVYQMGFGPILDGLEVKARAGVKVRVILDLAQKNVNQRYMDRLNAAGAEVIWSDPQFVFMHAKVLIIDRSEAIVSTGNYSQSYMLKERNFAVRDSDPADVATLSSIFEADFARTTPDLSCTRLLVAPVNARARLLDFIASAQRSIVVESMQLGDRAVRDALASKKAAGVDVRAVLADPSWIDANSAAAAFLKEHDIEARWMKNVHVKAIVVDGSTAYVGSINLSYNSIDRNREVGLLVTEPENIAQALATFERDWAASTPF